MTPAVRMGLSISVATGLYGISFGALSVAAGLNLWQTMALSALMFTGGSQFAFIGVVAGGGSGMAAVSAASLLGVLASEPKSSRSSLQHIQEDTAHAFIPSVILPVQMCMYLKHIDQTYALMPRYVYICEDAQDISPCAHI